MGRVWVILVVSLFLVLTISAADPSGTATAHSTINGMSQSVPSTPTSSYYNGTKAVNYGLMVHNDYLHTKYYPSGLNQSIMQKNMDYFSSEDCAHFVSEALIAGGLTELANNPPGDNLTNYQSGYPGSYGIVGVYRFADWLAGYDLPVFPDNATQMQTVGYQPIPASYAGTPQATIFYVMNYSMFPSYFLSPGDVIIDGGAGGGHAMLYMGAGEVVQTDPAAIWNYTPAADNNISFYGMLTYFGKNVSALYIHIPTFTNKSVRITVLHQNQNITGQISKIKSGEKLTFIGSYPNGVGQGNYSYEWTVNGKKMAESQFFNFTPGSGTYNVEMVVTGSTASVNTSLSFSTGGGIGTGIIPVFIVVIIVIAAASALIFLRKRK
jgi:hypothetical protein